MKMLTTEHGKYLRSARRSPPAPRSSTPSLQNSTESRIGGRGIRNLNQLATKFHPQICNAVQKKVKTNRNLDFPIGSGLCRSGVRGSDRKARGFPSVDFGGLDTAACRRRIARDLQRHCLELFFLFYFSWREVWDFVGGGGYLRCLNNLPIFRPFKPGAVSDCECGVNGLSFVGGGYLQSCIFFLNSLNFFNNNTTRTTI